MSFIITDDKEKMLSETAKMLGISEKDKTFRDAFLSGWKQGENPPDPLKVKQGE